MLFAHGDPITLVFMLIAETLRAAADNAGPILAVLLKLIGVLLVLPALVLITALVCGVLTAIFVRKKRWLFVVVSIEALALYVVLGVPAASFLLSDWPDGWAWLTIGLGGIVSLLAGLVTSTIIVAAVALLGRLFRKQSTTTPTTTPDAETPATGP